MTRHSEIEIIDEATLASFRCERLSPTALFALLRRHVQVLARIAIGVGKSHAVDQLLAWPKLYEFFDLVVYVSPTWAIINERRVVVDGVPDVPVPWMTYDPRPDKRCGALSKPWKHFETHGCAALARRELCESCPQRQSESPCEWPDRSKRVRESKLIFCTEQQFVLNPRFFDLLVLQSGSERPLLIFDEAKIVNASFEVEICDADLRRFEEVLADPIVCAKVGRSLASATRDIIQAIVAADDQSIDKLRQTSPGVINIHAADIQRVGWDQFGREFTYIGHELDLFTRSSSRGRSKSPDGTVRFTVRPMLERHLLVLSAHLNAHHFTHRLELTHIASPFENVRFRHSGTRIVNLCNRIGAESYFKKNSDQILGTIAVLIARNVSLGRTTLLISRKDAKSFCAEKLSRFLDRWHIRVRFLHDELDSIPTEPSPNIIPIIHYGILGTNDFASYESAYCLNSYYVSERVLNQAVNDAEPEKFKIGLVVRSSVGRRRRVDLEYPDPADIDLVTIAQRHLRHLEVDPVLQAVGRVRFATKPREILIFAMHDFREELGEYEEVQSLVALREALGIPSAQDVEAEIQRQQIVEAMNRGITSAEIAGRLNISPRTVFRRLNECSYDKNPTRILYKGFWHSFGSLAREEGVS